MSDNRDIAANLMKQAAVLVSSQRGQQHGDVTTSFTMIAELWSVWINHAIAKATGIPPTPPIHLTAFDALQMMSMVKKARGIYGNRAEPDHYIDDIGYTGLAGALNMVSTAQIQEVGDKQVGAVLADVPIPDFLTTKKKAAQ